MSGHWRFCFAACFLLADLSAAAAASNPFAALFGQTAPAQAPTQEQAPAKEDCLLRPGKSTDPGHHWFYYSDGHHKCWFQGAAATLRSPIRHRVIRHAAAPEGNEGTSRDPKAFADARDELPRSVPAQSFGPGPRSPDVKLVDATLVPATDALALVPATPVAGKAANDPVTPEPPTPPQLNDETLLAAAPATLDAVDASANSAAPIAVSAPEVSEAGRWSMASWLGVLLMALGGVTLLGASRTRRRGAQVGRFR